MTKILRPLLAAVLAFSVPHAAHTASPETATTAPSAALEDEEQVDDGLKRFGYLAGLARGCVVDSQQADLEREALDLHAGIARLLGTDRAFLFAAAFGYGTNVQVDTKDCAEVLKTYEERVAKFRAGHGAQK